MRKHTLLVLCLALSGAAIAAAESEDKDKDSDVLAFRTLAPVTGAYVGATNPIRGVPGGGLPWTITAARGELDRDGHIVVRVKGLVLANDPSVPENLRLTNPVPTFKAIVSCQVTDGIGNPAVVNVSTQNFAATDGGDALIRDEVDLPKGCIAPIVFVASPGGAWFASTGF
jgi:hypothetical protein